MPTPIRAHCAGCGLSFTAQGMIGVGEDAKITLSKVGISCPKCGFMASAEDGTYGAVGMIVEAARTSTGGLTDLRTFHSVAEAFQSGAISFQDAARQVEQISPAYVSLWDWMNSNGAALTVIIATLTLCIAYYAIIKADTGSDQTHADATIQLQATREETQAAQRSEQAQHSLQTVQDKIYELLAQQRSSELPAAQAYSLRSTEPEKVQPKRQAMKAVTHNRHERRKAAKIGKSPSSRW